MKVSRFFTGIDVGIIQKGIGRRHKPRVLRHTLLALLPRPRPRPRSVPVPGTGRPDSQSGRLTWPPPLLAGGPACATTLSRRALFCPRLSALSLVVSAFPRALVHLRCEVYGIARLPHTGRAHLLHLRHMGEGSVTDHLFYIKNCEGFFIIQ
jgi:hypothetical protein